ncbi:hypothetical protein [Pseudaestuariivita rosea]|uniref:hypothetical protein n=1 Tax=Pseudaestuariivita rosea TaxID=2763263 RepID=UPI001ABBCECD|nr:hypothetical protein [Pseudaestuariivita rosea]
MRFLPYIGTIFLAIMAIGLSWRAVQVISADAPTLQPNNIDISAEATEQNPLSLPSSRPDVYYTAILERPLFEPGRRPFVETSETPATPQQVAAPDPSPEELDEAPNIILLGVMQLSEDPSALLSINNAAPEWHRTGQTLAGWQLTEIENTWIELTRETRRLRVDMYR